MKVKISQVAINRMDEQRKVYLCDEKLFRNKNEVINKQNNMY